MSGTASIRPSLTMQLTSGVAVFVLVCGRRVDTLNKCCDNMNPHIPTLFSHPWVSPFVGQVRKKLQWLHPCIGGKTFLWCIPICSGSRPVPEVDIAEGEMGNYNICGHRRTTLEIPLSPRFRAPAARWQQNQNDT